MFQIRIVVKLGGPVGELGLFNQDLADLCGIQPKLAGEWISGGIERLSLVDLATIMTELELFELGDVFEVQIIGTPPSKEGRRERMSEATMAKVECSRMWLTSCGWHTASGLTRRCCCLTCSTKSEKPKTIIALRTCSRASLLICSCLQYVINQIILNGLYIILVCRRYVNSYKLFFC